MTFKNPLVLDGETVKLRLMAERQAQSGLVHVDWLRFTCPLRHVDFPKVENLFPTIKFKDGKGVPLTGYFADGATKDQKFMREMRIAQRMAELLGEEYIPTLQAYEMAEKVSAILGKEYQVRAEIAKGHDFFKYRWPIDRCGKEVGWVGFLASSDKDQQKGQAACVHVNLFGSACTFAQHGWREKMADLMEDNAASVTRCDLALDFFNGEQGWRMEDLHQMSRDGLFNHKGKRPKPDTHGNWTDGNSRSFYVGSKTAGKQTNIYEKGDELFGPEAENPWVRVELRWGNKLRDLPTEMLRRPDDFFAAASEWHTLTLAQAGAMAAPEAVPWHKALPLQTAKAEVQRNLRWAINIARSTFATLNQYLDIETLGELVDFNAIKKPGRLAKFTHQELQAAYASLPSISAAEAHTPSFAFAA